MSNTQKNPNPAVRTQNHPETAAVQQAQSAASNQNHLTWISVGNSGDSPRPAYTQAQVEAGALDGLCVLNSISDGVIGDERRFVGIMCRDRKLTNCIDVPDTEQEFQVTLYVHNNSRFGLDFCASNVGVSFDLSEGAACTHTITGHIFAKNTLYSEYWSRAKFISQKPFRIEYVKGSALLENNGIGKNGGRQLRDEIASGGRTVIGYTAMDGRIPGGYQYASYVTIRVRTIPDDSEPSPTGCTLSQKVRFSKDSEPWRKEISAQVGDKVDFQLAFQNTGTATKTNVMIRAQLPEGLRYLPGTTKLYNVKYDGDILSDEIATTGVNIGGYLPHANAYLRFTAEVIGDDLTVGPNPLTCQTQLSTNGANLQVENTVHVEKAPAPPEPSNAT